MGSKGSRLRADDSTMRPLIRLRLNETYQERYPSAIKQKLVISGLFLSDLMRCMSFQILALWIPWIMVFYDPLFARADITKPDDITLR